MSGNGDSDGPNKVKEVCTSKITSEDEDHPSKTVTASTLSKDDGDQNSPDTSINTADNALNEEILTMEEDVEAVIEKKLNPEKEKALDNDSSELDFELKWDDDNEVNSLDNNMPDNNSNEEPSEPLVWETTDNPNNDLNNEKSMENKSSLATSSQANFSNNDVVFKLDTHLKTDLTARTTDSESNSLDERLVYSDVEVPDMEEKELLDELDAHISKTDKDTDKSMVEENPLAPDITQEKSDNIIRQDLDSTEMDVDESKITDKVNKSMVEENPEAADMIQEKSDNIIREHLESTEMDVDESKITDKVEEPQLNDTISTITDMETSTYDVNVEHKLGNLDAMIEIPTQELIEDFDDTGDMSDGEQYDEDLLLQNDAEVTEPEVTSNNTKQDIEKRVTNKQENSDEDSAKDITTERTISELEDKLLADSPLNANDNAVVENTLLQKDTEVTEAEVTITTINALKDLEESKSNKQSKPEEESEFNIVETTSDLEDKLLADTALEDEDVAKLENKVAEKDSNIEETRKLDEDNIDKDIEMESNENQADITLAEVSHQESNFKEAEPKENVDISDSVSKKTLPEGSKEPSTVEEMESSTTENEAIPEDSRNTTVALDISDIMDTEHLSQLVDTETTEVITDLPKEADTKVITDDGLPSTSKSDLLLETKNNNTDTPKSNEKESSAKVDDFIDAIPSTSKSYDLLPKDDELKANIIDTEQPCTSKTDTQLKETEPDMEKPSTSMIQELSDADQETDTLGLLAESSRVMDDDDEQENEQDDDDDDDDFDQDDESNQMVAEQSEDSNAPHSETDVPQETAEADKESPEPTEVDKEFSDATETEKEFSDPPVASPDEAMEAVVEESLEVNENEVEKAVNSLIASNLEEESVDVQESDTDVKLSSDDSNSSSKLREILTRNKDKDDAKAKTEMTSPSKLKKLEISKPKNQYDIVDLEESSSEDDVQVVNKPAEDANVTNVNIPSSVEVLSAGGQLSQLTRREGEVVVSVPKPPPHKPARLNTGEISIKTATVTEPMLIPEATVSLQNNKTSKVGTEIFNLDSDDEEKDKDCKKAQEEGKCINTYCLSDSTVSRIKADAAATTYYGAKGAVCMTCAIAVQERMQGLIEGIKDFSPLLTLDMGQMREELVEISDSESEEEVEVSEKPEDAIGGVTAKFLEENLEEMFNSTWLRYNMDDRLQAAQSEIEVDVRRFEEECKEIDSMLSECQVATDKLRRDLYDTFAHERKELPPIVIIDTPTNAWSGLEEKIELPPEIPEPPTRQSKRRLPVTVEPPAKKPAIPLGYTPLEDNKPKVQEAKVPAADIPIQNEDDNADIKVVKLSAEVAPAGLPGSGPARRPPLRPGMQVYAMRNSFGAWIRARIADVLPKQSNASFTMCRVKFEHKVKNPCKVLPARCLAYDQPSEVRMTIGTRVIALFADTQSNTKSYYSGIIAEIPNPVNNYRYLVFFDDGYAQYVQHQHTRLVCECAPLVWDEVHPFSRQFVRDYLRAYPERPMVRAHAGQSLKTEWNGKWWVSKVIQVDASLVQVHFEEDNRTEWIYRGSTRLAPLYLELQAAERQRARPLPRAAPGRRVNMPYVEYTRSDEPAPAPPPAPVQTQTEQDIRKQRAVAKKSTAAPQPTPAAPIDGVSSRVVFYTPKNAIKPLKMVPHTCGPRCRRTDVLALKDLRTYNPLTKPLLSGWERQIVKYRFTKSVMYRAPCGRRIRDYGELHRYLQCVGTDMGVDLFDFGVNTHCLAEFVLNKCLVSKKDLSHGRENVPVPCVNYYDFSLPEFCSYNTERTPTAGVPLNLDPEFLCGCDCKDDCADKTKCACWKMTLEGARTIGLDTDDVGYVYKRLPEPLPSGIYECNVRCKCRQTCLNRVAQHPLQLKLQVFKTLNRGWGIRALNDVPKGAFLCVYAGNLLTDATANLDGLNEGDEYLAELDYIEVVEQMKEGFEEDIPEADKKLDKEEESSSSSSSSEDQDPRNDTEDADFRPELKNVTRSRVSEYSKRLRKREKTKKKENENKEKQKEKQKDKEASGEDCITISDDEELREPSRFAAQAGMGGSEFVSKYKSVRAHFGKDEACYIMDAKVQGNIGRYLNHSCTPNVFVQNVFVDTHDPRFPWVAFFALAHIRAGTELTWNYNYDVGSVPGKTLYCHCGAPNCRGRLL